MGRAVAAIDVPGRVSDAEALWYDHTRWPTFVDGLAHVDKVQGDWPQPGARLLWVSQPGGRGRVVEEVTEYEARVGQTVHVEDEHTTPRSASPSSRARTAPRCASSSTTASSGRAR